MPDLHPLSRSTRQTRTALGAASITGLVYSVFGMPTGEPVRILAIDVPLHPWAVPIVLFGIIVYLMVSFLSALKDERLNEELLPAEIKEQDENERRYQARLNLLKKEIGARAQTDFVNVIHSKDHQKEQFNEFCRLFSELLVETDEMFERAEDGKHLVPAEDVVSDGVCEMINATKLIKIHGKVLSRKEIHGLMQRVAKRYLLTFQDAQEIRRRMGKESAQARSHHEFRRKYVEILPVIVIATCALFTIFASASLGGLSKFLPAVQVGEGSVVLNGEIE